MPGQQSVQYVRAAAEAGIPQTIDRTVKPDQTAAGREVEDAQCPRHGEALAPGSIHAITVIDGQQLSPYSNRELDRSSFAIVQV